MPARRRANEPSAEPEGVFTETPLDNASLEDPFSGPETSNGQAEEQQPLFAGFDEPTHDEKRPTPHAGKRESLADLVALAWGGAGMVLVQSQTDVPVGRVLQFQAPMAGNKLDALIAGTWVDTLLQPLAKKGDAMKEVGALVLLPLMVGAWERQPELMMPLEPVMRELVRASLLDMVPVMKKRRQEEAKAAKAMADLSDVIDFEPGVDPLDAILGSFFAPPPGAEPEPGTEPTDG